MRELRELRRSLVTQTIDFPIDVFQLLRAEMIEWDLSQPFQGESYKDCA